MNRRTATPPRGLRIPPTCCGRGHESLGSNPGTSPGAGRAGQLSRFETEVPCRV
jgi:hypothetical protein